MGSGARLPDQRPAPDRHRAVAISASGLVKAFGATRALDGLDLVVPTGEVHGFLGPNGAGKTTTIRILLGLLRTSAGRVTLLGGDPWREAAELHRRLAYVPGEVNLWPNLTGGEVIDLLGALRGGLDPARRAELLDRFDLDPTKKVPGLLEGQPAEGGARRGLLLGRRAYLLDEPTSGLDPLMETVFQDVVRGVRERGAPCCCPATSSPRSRRCATGSRSSAQAAPPESGTFDELRHLTRTTVVVETARTAERLDGLAGVHDLSLDHHAGQFSVDPGELNQCCSGWSRWRSGR